MRDVLIIPFNGEESLVIASDNSGGIGLKEMDEVYVPYEVVAYYSFRVAVMECMAAGGAPFAVTLLNFCGEQAWKTLMDGIHRGIEELGLARIQVNGSTESNFSLVQSAAGLTVLGKVQNDAVDNCLEFSEETMVAVIGKPLVGNEVVEFEGEVAPLSLFKELCLLEDVILLPVGSKGILYELNQLFSNRTFKETEVSSSLDIKKSAGPSTCFLAVFSQEKKEEIMAEAGRYFHKVEVIKC
ncbi:ATP-binding protein [Bacillus sp. DTU_2020_1000418_1_SI_GHA_SEK_038]|uniref:ATP-binding protein n=1 Tax=Bacillus sp. DTU_2020_1000418_1_SI_GHA_SEK_038 TaxID=3077585 RepID=UPI0028EA78EB|nr:ATP-binding protein [Bacillus sp. DTU_2020_1000418_1_SI_GHA_SEK_038]WNS75919.1 ATP-binding protein [Bacillus sp. DTU_2020_1000418_1_SI_GHA_SEK_038]